MRSGSKMNVFFLVNVRERENDFIKIVIYVK